MGKYWFLVSVLGPVLLTSCGGGAYRGYMTRSYTIRGVRYHPMSVEQALRYEETGIASWYDESSFLGFKRGRTSLGEKVGRFPRSNPGEKADQSVRSTCPCCWMTGRIRATFSFISLPGLNFTTARGGMGTSLPGFFGLRPTFALV